MNKRKWLSMLLCSFIAVLLLTGCQGKDDPGYKDAEFLVALGKGLDRRWDLSDKQKADPEGTSSKEDVEALVQCELDSVEKFANEKFEDPKLRELAVTYVNALHDQMDASDDYASQDDQASYVRWNRVYANRVMILKDIMEKYEVKTAKKHEEVRSQLLSDGRVAQKTADVEEALGVIADGIQFAFADDGNGYVIGTANAVNNSGMDFEHVEFDVQMYDGSGVRTQTESAFVENWNDGETVTLEVHPGDKGAPASVKVVPSYYAINE